MVVQHDLQYGRCSRISHQVHLAQDAGEAEADFVIEFADDGMVAVVKAVEVLLEVFLLVLICPFMPNDDRIERILELYALSWGHNYPGQEFDRAARKRVAYSTR